MPIENSYLNENSKFCGTCGSEIHKQADICPNCGVRCNNGFDNLVQGSYNKSRKSVALAIVGVVLGVIFGILLYLFMGSVSIISSSVVGNSADISKIVAYSLVCILASLLGIIGIILEGYDKKVAAYQYVVCGIFVLIGGMLFFGLIPSIFFFVAGILAYQDGNKVVDYNE